MMALLTAKELVSTPFPELLIEDSQCRNSSKTYIGSPRTFSRLLRWDSFIRDLEDFKDTLDGQNKKYRPPDWTHPLDPCDDEVGIRGALQYILYSAVNSVAKDIRLPYQYASGGSGRSFSCTDDVILDRSVPQPQGNRKELSIRVYGIGEVKGPWQWELEGSQQVDNAMCIVASKNKIEPAIQQMYGDMVMEECRYGYVSNYNQTVFFRRSPLVKCKNLEFSPVIEITDAPVLAFLFVLTKTFEDKATKANLKRELVPATPIHGYKLALPPLPLPPQFTSRGRALKRQSVPILVKATKKRMRQLHAYVDLSNHSVQDFQDLPVYAIDELGLSGRIIGMGKYGNVLEGVASNDLCLAIKTFDLRIEKATASFLNEQVAYKRLKELQGYHVPIMIAIGRLPHCNVVYLVLSDEGNTNITHATRGQRTNVLGGLEKIHAKGVLHGDLKPSHILLNGGVPKFIDFEQCLFDESSEAYTNEKARMAELLS